MSLNLIAEVWDALSSHIDLHDRKDAADTLVNLLIESNCEANEIKAAFKGDKDVTKALKYYHDQQDTEEEYDEDEYEEDEEWD
jgi:succinate dehydrogenase/fumarate reductase-like Fe-S protein